MSFSIALLAVLSATSVQDLLSGAEIGDAATSVSFGTNGQYKADRQEKKAATHASGTWKLEGDDLVVKVDGCKGPSEARTVIARSPTTVMLAL